MWTKTQMNPAGGDGTESSTNSPASWSNLPDDLLGNIRLRLASLRDRAGLAAACRPWRAAAARLPGPPAVPLLLLWPCRGRSSARAHLCGPVDAWVTRVPAKLENSCFVGSHDGGWIAAFNFNNSELTIANFFSGACVAVLRSRPVCKVVFSDAPTSSNGCILAAIPVDTLQIALRKVGGGSWWTIKCPKKKFVDITFCGGDLYGLTYHDEELVKFKINVKENGPSMVTSAHQLAVQRRHGPTAKDDPNSYNCRIFELHGKPSIAIRTRWLRTHEPFFKVFILIDANVGEAYQHKWAQVMSSGDYALFLGPTGSKAVHVPLGGDRRGLGEKPYILL